MLNATMKSLEYVKAFVSGSKVRLMVAVAVVAFVLLAFAGSAFAIDCPGLDC